LNELCKWLAVGGKKRGCRPTFAPSIFKSEGREKRMVFLHTIYARLEGNAEEKKKKKGGEAGEDCSLYRERKGDS